MKEMSLVERHVQEGEEHVIRMAARIEELTRLGMTQAANEKQATLLALRKIVAADRENLRHVRSR